jgi:hypothetical protein
MVFNLSSISVKSGSSASEAAADVDADVDATLWCDASGVADAAE